MNFGEWKAQLIERPGVVGYQLYLYRVQHDGKEFLKADGTAILVKAGALEDVDSIYFASLTNDQIQTLAEAFANKGIQTQNDHKNAGLLEAQKAHLEDMRSLVFKKK
jgi:hypothetical protein